MADVGQITELWRAAADALERPLPREPQWGAPYRDALQAEVARLRQAREDCVTEGIRVLERAERAEVECGRLREQLDAARQALKQIDKAARDARADSDSWDDNGGHVGVGRYQHARVDGLAQAADIARAALGVVGL